MLWGKRVSKKRRTFIRSVGRLLVKQKKRSGMSLPSFLDGIVGAIIAFLVRYWLRTSKFVLKYEYPL